MSNVRIIFRWIALSVCSRRPRYQSTCAFKTNQISRVWAFERRQLWVFKTHILEILLTSKVLLASLINKTVDYKIQMCATSWFYFGFKWPLPFPISVPMWSSRDATLPKSETPRGILPPYVQTPSHFSLFGSICGALGTVHQDTYLADHSPPSHFYQITEWGGLGVPTYLQKAA